MGKPVTHTAGWARVDCVKSGRAAESAAVLTALHAYLRSIGRMVSCWFSAYDTEGVGLCPCFL